MNRFLLLVVPILLFSSNVRGGKENELSSLPEDELTVIVNGQEVTGEEKKARLQGLAETESEARLKGAGIGVLIKAGTDGGPVIVKTLTNSPAAKAGLTPGDVIAAIDDESMKGLAFTKEIGREHV